jgi:hypothetical protein
VDSHQKAAAGILLAMAAAVVWGEFSKSAAVAGPVAAEAPNGAEMAAAAVRAGERSAARFLAGGMFAPGEDISLIGAL